MSVEKLHPAGVDLVLNNAAMQEPVARGSEAYVTLHQRYTSC